MTIELADSLKALRASTKAAQLRVLLPLIEAKRTEGVQHAEIVRLLNDQGLGLTLATYRNYLHRLRKEAHRPQSTPTASSPAPIPAGVVASASTPLISAPKAGAATRPPTFDYDPRGIPDLLK